MTTLQDKIGTLPPQRQARIRARVEELAREEATLSGARKRVQLTQAGMAKKLGIGQDSVSRLEARKDMLVSTLRNYVAALGGTVRVVVEWKGQPAVELKTLGTRARAARKKGAAKKGAGREVA